MTVRTVVLHGTAITLLTLGSSRAAAPTLGASYRSLPVCADPTQGVANPGDDRAHGRLLLSKRLKLVINYHHVIVA